MVLQAGTARAAIYGNDNATTVGDTITVTVAPASAAPGGPFTATATASGSWAVTLGKMESSAVPITLTVTPKAGGAAAAQVLSNVLRGNVYICSGQVLPPSLPRACAGSHRSGLNCCSIACSLTVATPT